MEGGRGSCERSSNGASSMTVCAETVQASNSESAFVKRDVARQWPRTLRCANSIASEVSTEQSSGWLKANALSAVTGSHPTGERLPLTGACGIVVMKNVVAGLA